jgi:DNA-binding GntR family transcriptional regulator
VRVTEPWPIIRSKTLSDHVYHVLRARIGRGLYGAGEFIREQEISVALGVSRTPVREALSRLASEGLLERMPHRGFRVAQEPLRDALELYPILGSLDLLAGRLAFPDFAAGDFAELERINAQLEEAIEAGEPERAVDLNYAFHRYISARTGNSRLATMLDDLRARVRPWELWYFENVEDAEHQSVDEHAEILRAVRAGDVERALEIFETNMFWTYKVLLEAPESDVEARR